MKINKKLLQLVAALWILVYHVWISVTNGIPEQYILKVGYVGVDIFFFTAAYSLADKKIEYGSFIKDRFINIYLKFVLLTVFAVIYKKWTMVRAIKILTFTELFQRGGGAFLWFIPAIMIFYLLYPLFLRITSRYKILWVLLGWIALSLVLEKGLGYTDIFIVTNRIPVMMAGYYFKTHKLNKWIGFSCVPLGMVLLYFFGFNRRLSVPVRDIYFVIGIVLVLGLTYVSGYVKENRVIAFLGSATIEMYGFQMIFGTKLAGSVYKYTGTKLLTNLITVIIIWMLSLMCAKAFSMIKGYFGGKRNGN